MNHLLFGQFASVLLLAQDAADPAAQPSPVMQFLPFLAIGLLFYFILIRPERRKQREHAALLGQLKKNDRVVTIGGIYGTVFSVQKDADRVTLKVDEGTNTKIDVTFGSIARVLGDETATKKDAKES